MAAYTRPFNPKISTVVRSSSMRNRNTQLFIGIGVVMMLLPSTKLNPYLTKYY